MISKTEQKLTYPVSLLLSIPGRKTFEFLAKNIGVSGDSVARMVENYAATVQDLVNIAKAVFKGKKLYLIIDDTLILKLYSKVIQGTCDNYDSSDRKTYRSLCAVVAVITDGIDTIPISEEIWISEALNKDTHMKKWQLAQALITQLQTYLSIHMLLADGLYAIHVFLTWLISENINFEMRLHANRVIDHDTFSGQVKNSPKFMMKNKKKMRTIRATWKNTDFYISAFRRTNKNGDVTTIYQISNYKAASKVHIQSYGYRWNIEKFFRTAKQKLGLNDCQSRKLNLQQNHIMSVFLIYSLLQIERKKYKIKNIETVIKRLNLYDFDKIRLRLMRLAENFCYA